jgi:integrase/recombinase XerD
LKRLVVVILAVSLPYREGIKVAKILREWRAGWLLAGRSEHTITNYSYNLMGLFNREPEYESWDLATVKEWIGAGGSEQQRRMRARSVKAFLRWADEEEVFEASYWKRIKLPNVHETPQETASETDYRLALAKATMARDKALVAVLWSSGMRRAEVARVRIEHLDLDNGAVVVPITKTGNFRTAPLSPEACKFLRAYMRKHPQLGDEGPLWLGERGSLGADGIRHVLERLGAPSSHAFRRGWTCDALEHGVSQTSVQAAAGWAGPAMVSRYTRQNSNALALKEFGRRWAS